MSLKVRVFVLLAALLALTMVSTAQEQTPAETPQENACYAGGSLEGKCDWPTDAEDEWAWSCGWYIARVENGVISQAGVPDWCNHFKSSAPETLCYAPLYEGLIDLALVAPIDTLKNARFYESMDGTCTGEYFSFTMIRSVILDLEDPDLDVEVDFAPAIEKCVAVTGKVEVFPLPIGVLGIFDGLPLDYWVCITAEDFDMIPMLS